jgi:hypothetical protein
MVGRSKALLITAAAALAALPAAQPQGSSVAALIDLVRKAIQKNESDNKLAGELRKIWLAQSLDDRTVEELESEGAGPKSVAEMLELKDLSVNLPAPVALPEFASPPLPLRAEQDEILKNAADHADAYSSSLPDFICTEVIHRYEDLGGTGKWKLKDVLKVKLTYFERREDYELVAVNNHPTGRRYDFESVGGAVSEGEFGTDLSNIFLPQSQTRIRWDHWTHLRRHAAHVFFYRISLANARARIEFGYKGSRIESTRTGEHGFFYVDRDTNQVLRISRTNDLPPDFPVRKATMLLDYDFVSVGGRQYLLPLRADMRMATDYILTRNQIEFTEYRKFEGESKITFDQAK